MKKLQLFFSQISKRHVWIQNGYCLLAVCEMLIMDIPTLVFWLSVHLEEDARTHPAVMVAVIGHFESLGLSQGLSFSARKHLFDMKHDET